MSKDLARANLSSVLKGVIENARATRIHVVEPGELVYVYIPRSIYIFIIIYLLVLSNCYIFCILIYYTSRSWH